MQYVTISQATELLELGNASMFYNTQAFREHIVSTEDGNRVPMNSIKALQQAILDKQNLRYDMTSFIDYLLLKYEDEALAGINSYSRRATINQEIKKHSLLTYSSARYIHDNLYTINDKLREEYLLDVGRRANGIYVPLEEREAILTKEYLVSRYWHRRKSVRVISEELNIPEHYIYEKIKEFDLSKNKYMIQKAGRQGYVMPLKEREAHHKQPHAKRVSRICPVTFETVKTYRSQAAAEEDGFNRENVKRAVKTAGMHKGYLWALEGLEEATIRVAKRKTGRHSIAAKMTHKKEISKDDIKRLYVTMDLTRKETAKRLGIGLGLLDNRIKQYKLKKRGKPLTKDDLIEYRVGQRLSIEEIAEITGKTTSTIATYLGRYKIRKPRDQKAENSHFQKQKETA